MTMTPYHIRIDWVDFNPTIEDDMYEVTVLAADNKTVIATSTISKQSLPYELNKYLNT